QEGKYGFGHAPVLQRQVARHDLYLIGSPALEAFRGFEDVRQLGFRGLGFLHACSDFPPWSSPVGSRSALRGNLLSLPLPAENKPLQTPGPSSNRRAPGFRGRSPPCSDARTNIRWYLPAAVPKYRCTCESNRRPVRFHRASPRLPTDC